MNNETKNQVSNYDFEYIFNTSSCEGDFKTDVNINAFGYKASGTRKFSSMKMLIRFMLQMTECMNLKDAVLTVHGNSREHEMALEALEQAQNKVSEIETNALDSLNEKLKTPTAKQEVVEQIAPSAPSTQLLDFTDPTTSDDAPSAPKEELTPMLKQFNDMKEKHPDAVLLFRCGDFYESYKEDAKVLSDVLGITLTKRNTPDGYYMAGFPHHALDTYLPKLIRAGKRVAICDQIEQKPVIKRGRKPKVEETKEIAI